jgi:hypothetical protein
MTISVILMIINLVLLWWLFLSASNMGLKILMLLLAVLNSWLALERFHVLPTRFGNRLIFSSYQHPRGAAPGRLQARN